MELVILLIILVILLAGFGVIWQFLKGQAASKNEDKSFLLIQNQINELNRTVDTKLSESSKVIREQFTESARIIKEITHELTKVGEGQKQVMNVTNQLKNLQDILKNPKQRGVLGEYYLETLLKNILPPNSFQMQYKFKNGEIVDAAVFVKDKVIPIDSKFSLENYNRMIAATDQSERERLEKVFVNDLKLRITETAKYVRPNEDTMDFAFMFIPHEAIYYDLLINKVGAITEDTENLIQRAAGKYHVIIVSPTSFLAYLQTVLQGLRAMQIEESAKEIRQNVELLTKHLSNYAVNFQKLGSHLSTTVGMYNSAHKELGKIDKDILKITSAPIGIEPLEIEKPRLDNEE